MLSLYVFVRVAFLSNKGEVGGHNLRSDESGIFGLWGVEFLGVFVFGVSVMLVL